MENVEVDLRPSLEHGSISHKSIRVRDAVEMTTRSPR